MFPPEPTQKHRVYCLICGADFSVIDSAAQHVKLKHEQLPKHTVNFAEGWQVEQMRARFLADATPRILVFIKSLRQENYGAEDFLVDCGYIFP